MRMVVKSLVGSTWIFCFPYSIVRVAILKTISDSITGLHEQRKTGYVHEFCFELLHNLLTRHALFDSLEEYFFGQIINVDSGCFIYNDLTLTLLAHFLTCRVGSAGSQLKNNILQGRYRFHCWEDKSSLFKMSKPQGTFFGTLPSMFHIEILLMACHLSTKVENIMNA